MRQCSLKLKTGRSLRSEPLQQTGPLRPLLNYIAFYSDYFVWLSDLESVSDSPFVFIFSIFVHAVWTLSNLCGVLKNVHPPAGQWWNHRLLNLVLLLPPSHPSVQNPSSSTSFTNVCSVFLFSENRYICSLCNENKYWQLGGGAG